MSDEICFKGGEEMSRIPIFTEDVLRMKTVEFILKYGFSELNIRKLANFCGCSTQPFYNCFGDFKKLKYEVIMQELTLFDRYLARQEPESFVDLIITLQKFHRQYPDRLPKMFFGNQVAYELMKDTVQIYFDFFSDAGKTEDSDIEYSFDTFWYLAVGCVMSKTEKRNIDRYSSIFKFEKSSESSEEY